MCQWKGVEPNWDQIRVEGKNYRHDDPPLRLYNYVSPGFFQALGTRMVAGRDFTWNEIYGLRPEVIVSENFARESWGSPRRPSANGSGSLPIRPGRKWWAWRRTSASKEWIR